MMEAACENGYAPVRGSPAMMMVKGVYTEFALSYRDTTNAPSMFHFVCNSHIPEFVARSPKRIE